MVGSAIAREAKLIGALVIREITTRFGRQNLGFLWVIGEPLVFCCGVLLMWSVLKPSYENGVRLGPFVMTGYMCLLLLRHMMSFSLGALQANTGLLHHRRIAVIHIYVARNLMELAGATIAFAIVYVALFALGQVSAPHNWLLLYAGWFLYGWVSFGIALLFAGLAMRYEIAEKLVSVIGYMMIPASGAFIMAAYVPASFRDAYLLIPLPHGVEMVRAGVFGEFVQTYYDPLYAFAWGCVMVFAGLVLLADAKDRVLID